MTDTPKRPRGRPRKDGSPPKQSPPKPPPVIISDRKLEELFLRDKIARATNGPGRVILTRALHDAIVGNIKAGTPMKGDWCAIQAGVPPTAFRDWLKWGEHNKKGRFWEFWMACRTAEANYMARSARKVSDSPDTADHKWILERRFPAVYGPTVHVETNIQVSRRLEQQVAETAAAKGMDVTADELREWAENERRTINASAIATDGVPALPAAEVEDDAPFDGVDNGFIVPEEETDEE